MFFWQMLFTTAMLFLVSYKSVTVGQILILMVYSVSQTTALPDIMCLDMFCVLT